MHFHVEEVQKRAKKNQSVVKEVRIVITLGMSVRF